MAILDEDVLRIEDAAALHQTHFSTCYRWIFRGAKDPAGNRVRLEAVRLGGRWITSRQALQRFSDALTPRLDGAPVPTPRPSGKRQRASEKAADQLSKIGI